MTSHVVGPSHVESADDVTSGTWSTQESADDVTSGGSFTHVEYHYRKCMAVVDTRYAWHTYLVRATRPISKKHTISSRLTHTESAD